MTKRARKIRNNITSGWAFLFACDPTRASDRSYGATASRSSFCSCVIKTPCSL